MWRHIQSTLVIPKSKDSLKYFEISVSRHIRFAELRKINRTTTFHKWTCKLTPEDRDILKILWKGRKISPFLLFSTIFCYLLLDFHVKTGTRFSRRDKRLFEISEVEIRESIVYRNIKEHRKSTYGCMPSDQSLLLIIYNMYIGPW